jgi:transposase
LEDHDLPGRTASRCIAAPCLFDGTTNGERYLPYVEQVLVPILRPGDIVIVDNSPDANPIEQVFAKL